MEDGWKNDKWRNFFPHRLFVTDSNDTGTFKEIFVCCDV